MSSNGPCIHGTRPHTVMYWLADGGPPVPMIARFDSQPDAVDFAERCIQKDNPILRWIKIFRSDNESYTCWRWENPVPFTPEPVEYERTDSIAVKPSRWWQSFLTGK